MPTLPALAVDFAVALIAAVVAVVVWRQRRASPPPVDVPPPALRQLVWLDETQHARWQRQYQRFLREKSFIGCAGLSVSDAQRSHIAGIACLLRLQATAEAEPLFPEVREVLLYPEAFLVPPQREAVSEEGLELVDDMPDERIGEHGPGQVVLSWADVEAALAGDAVNVVIHEFAHALDGENPGTEGAPPMADYTEWSAVMGAEFKRLQRHRRPPVLDPYGAQSPAEFWCVVAEAFFQQPEALARHHASLFQLLTRYLEITPLFESKLAAAMPPA
ncbi:MAG: M90 family metallopeptidase [Pseudomonadota bacterium]